MSNINCVNCLFILVTHGSSDRRHLISAALLCDRLKQWFIDHGFPNYRVEAAVLESDESSLADQVMDQLDRARIQGIERAVLVPLFLLPGMHVMEDIPAQFDAIRTRISIADGLPYPILSVMPFLGDWPTLKMGLLDHLITDGDCNPDAIIESGTGQSPARILLAHGSRRPGAVEPIETIAAKLGLSTAYWLVEPKLDFRIEDCIATGASVIEIFPYFLFEGGISDAIDRLVQGFPQRYPHVEFVMHDVLALRPDFVAMIGQELSHFVGALAERSDRGDQADFG